MSSTAKRRMIHDEADLAALDRLARDALPAWELAANDEVTLVSVSENATYRLSGGGRSLALRFVRPGHRSEAAIRSELAWIDALRRAGTVATPAPVPDRDGAPFRRLVGEDGTTRVAIAFAWWPGEAPSAGAAILPERFHTLGAVTARLHAHAATWTRPAWFTRPTWTPRTTLGPAATWGDVATAAGPGPAARALIARTVAAIRRRLAGADGIGAPSRGLVHGDLRLANLLQHDGELAIIDFDDCGEAWLAYDFAAAASFMEDTACIGTLRAAWCEGYRAVRCLDAADEASMPALLMLRRLQLAAWLAGRPTTDAARQHGARFANGTAALAERFLAERREAA